MIMSAIAIQQMADRVAELMETRLGIKGRGLAEKLKRGGGKLPRKVRTAASELSKAAEMAQSPKLYLQLDQAAIAQNYDLCLRHLGGLQKWARRRALMENWLLSLLTSLIVLAAIIAAILRWRGYF